MHQVIAIVRKDILQSTRRPLYFVASTMLGIIILVCVGSALRLRDYMTPGLAAYLCYVIACMNIGFAWIYEWTDKTYKQISLAPNGVRAAIAAKTLVVTVEASVVLWLALCIARPLAGFALGNNFFGLVGITLASMFCFTCIGLSVACMLRTIRVYSMVSSICGVAWLFVSGIVIPVEAMPQWERVLAYSFPVYYCADAFKGVMLGSPAFYARDIAVLLLWAVAGLCFSAHVLGRRRAV